MKPEIRFVKDNTMILIVIKQMPGQMKFNYDVQYDISIPMAIVPDLLRNIAARFEGQLNSVRTAV